ncbi:MAG TPA: restriction endonuclease subunit S [Candidatus Angelobacter sp.]|nr:restriction endonuclease subunit S [Candidatus Angelobacter sp.]
MSFAVKAIGSDKVFVTRKTQLEQRWDPNYYRLMSLFRAKVENSSHPIQRLRQSLDLVQYGISERATKETNGIAMLRMINLQADTWELSDLKYIAMSVEERRPYRLYAGDILFNRTNSKELVGKCVVFNLPGEYVFASYLIRVRLKEGSLLPDYLVAYLASPLGRLQIDAVSRQIAGMTNINAEEIRELLVPVPNRQLQEKVAAVWRDAIQSRDETLELARKVLASIDDSLLGDLGIGKAPGMASTVSERIFRRAFSHISGRRLDAAANWQSLSLRGGRFAMRSLREVAAINPPSRLPKLAPTAEVSFVPMDAVSDSFGEICERRSRPLGELKGYTAFQEGDLLWAKITPCMENGKSAMADGLIGGFGFGSTEFHVFRATSTELDMNFLHLVLRLKAVRNYARLFFTGSSGHQRVDQQFFKYLEIPLPPMDVQREIVNKAEDIKRNARELFDRAFAELETAKSEVQALILDREHQH